MRHQSSALAFDVDVARKATANMAGTIIAFDGEFIVTLRVWSMRWSASHGASEAKHQRCCKHVVHVFRHDLNDVERGQRIEQILLSYDHHSFFTVCSMRFFWRAVVEANDAFDCRTNLMANKRWRLVADESQRRAEQIFAIKEGRIGRADVVSPSRRDQ